MRQTPQQSPNVSFRAKTYYKDTLWASLRVYFRTNAVGLDHPGAKEPAFSFGNYSKWALFIQMAFEFRFSCHALLGLIAASLPLALNPALHFSLLLGFARFL